MLVKHPQICWEKHWNVHMNVCMWQRAFRTECLPGQRVSLWALQGPSPRGFSRGFTRAFHRGFARSFIRYFTRVFGRAFASEVSPISVGKNTEMCVCMWHKTFAQRGALQSPYATYIHTYMHFSLFWYSHLVTFEISMTTIIHVVQTRRGVMVLLFHSCYIHIQAFHIIRQVAVKYIDKLMLLQVFSVIQ